MSHNRTITPDQLLRHFIGYDRLNANASAFPPHNIEKLSEDAYRLTLAVAGFGRDEIEMYEHKGTLTISGRKKAQAAAAESTKSPRRVNLNESPFTDWVDADGNVSVDPRAEAAKSQAALKGKFGINETPEPVYLHQGIALRDWDRQFNLGEHIEVKSASIENGLLLIDLERHVPEAHKPKLIEIRG